MNSNYVSAAQAAAGAVPAVQVNAAAAPAGGAATPAASMYNIPYNLQSGLTKYAPMQPVPPTKITQNQATPLFPTSSYSVATTWLARPSIVTTMTLPQTFSVSSVENTVSQKFSPTSLVLTFFRPLLNRTQQATWPDSLQGGKIKTLDLLYNCTG